MMSLDDEAYGDVFKEVMGIDPRYLSMPSGFSIILHSQLDV